MASFQHYFERFALASSEKQEQLHRSLGDHSVELDLDAGIARFSSGLSCRFQVLGTESENTLNWLWGWAEEQTEMPEALLATCHELRSWAEKQQVAEFLSPSLDLNKADGNMLSLVASALSNATAYYRDHYEGGALFVLLFCDNREQSAGFDRTGLLRRFNELVQLYEVDARNMLISYFRERGLPLALSQTHISGELTNGERVIADLDDQGRIMALNGEPFSADRSR